MYNMATKEPKHVEANKTYMQNKFDCKNQQSYLSE